MEHVSSVVSQEKSLDIALALSKSNAKRREEIQPITLHLSFNVCVSLSGFS